MDFDLSWQQMELRRTARSFLERAATLEELRAAEASPDGFSRDTYSAMADLGLLQLALPEALGGSGDFLDQVLLYEEFGRAALASPYFVSAGLAIRLLFTLGSTDQRKLLSSLATGDTIGTVALYELDSTYEPSSIQLQASTQREGHVVDGTKLYVPYARAADWLLVLARTGFAAEQLTWFVVPRSSPGLTCTPLRTLSGERQFAVHFDRVNLGADALLGELHSGWSTFEAILPAATVLQAAELVGTAEVALELAIDYARRRVAFGQPIGSFQAIQHMCADAAADCDGARFLVYQAACRVRDGAVEVAEVYAAKAFAAAAAARVTKTAQQIFGGAGFVLEHRLSYWYRRARGIELALGDADHMVDLVAERTIARVLGEHADGLDSGA